LVAIKAQQAESFLKAPDPRLSAVLLYGPDAGLVVERSRALARMLAERGSPPGEIVQLEDADLESDPGRLGLELQTMPMFGGRKIIRARAGRRIAVPLIKPLLEGPIEGFLIIEGGDLKGDEGLRGQVSRRGRRALLRR
jgi:DNA polymerase III subunit delta